MTTDRITRMMSSWRSVTSFSVAKRAATITKKKMPPTHAAMAVSDLRVGAWPLTRALRSVVITRAIAPSGWTTMSGATASAPSWQMIAMAEHERAHAPRTAG